MDARMLVGMDDPRSLQTRRMMPSGMSPEALAAPATVALGPPPPAAGAASLAGASMAHPAPVPAAGLTQPTTSRMQGPRSLADVRTLMRKQAEQLRRDAGLRMDDAVLEKDTDILMANWGAAVTRRLGKKKEKQVNHAISTLRSLQTKYANLDDGYEEKMLPYAQKGRRGLAIMNDPGASPEDKAKARAMLLETKEHMDIIKDQRDTLKQRIRDYKKSVADRLGVSPQDIDVMMENPRYDAALRAQTETEDFRDDEGDEDPYDFLYQSAGSANPTQ